MKIERIAKDRGGTEQKFIHRLSPTAALAKPLKKPAASRRSLAKLHSPALSIRIGTTGNPSLI